MITQQHAAASSSTQQQAAASSSKQQHAAARSSTQQQAAASSSKQQQAEASSSKRQTCHGSLLTVSTCFFVGDVRHEQAMQCLRQKHVRLLVCDRLIGLIGLSGCSKCERGRITKSRAANLGSKLHFGLKIMGSKNNVIRCPMLIRARNRATPHAVWMTVCTSSVPISRTPPSLSAAQPS